MDPKNMALVLRNSLLDCVSAHTSERRVALRMGRSKDYLAWLRRRKTPLDWVESLELVGASQLPDWLVFDRVFPRPKRPADLMRQIHELLHPEFEIPPLLEHLGATTHQAQRKWVVEAEVPRCPNLPLLLWIEKRRFQDMEENAKRLDRQICLLLVELNVAERIDPSLLTELSFAMGIWADTQRLERKRDIALAAWPLALDLAELSGERWAMARALWGAAQLLGDFGLPDCALPWLDRAAALLAFDQHTATLAELLVSQGTLQLANGDPETALGTLREALERLPAVDRRWRHPALLHRAAAAQALGHYGEAEAGIATLLLEHRENDHFQGQILCRRAALLLETGEAAEAISVFSKATQLLLRHDLSYNAIYLYCDFAEFLIEKELDPEAATLAAEMMRRVGESAASPRVAAVVEDLYAAARMRRLNLDCLEEARFQLEEYGPRPERLFPPRPAKKSPGQDRGALPEVAEIKDRPAS